MKPPSRSPPVGGDRHNDPMSSSESQPVSDQSASGIGPSRMGVSRSWSDEDLIRAVAEGNSVVDCVRALGLAERSAGNWKRVNEAIRRLELPTDHWVSRQPARVSEAVPLAEVMVENSTYKTSNLRRRLLREGVKAHCCERCRRTEWEGEPIPLELEHINGVANDHRLENLLLLCPNCHALTPTWRGRKNLRNRCADCGTRVASKSQRCNPCAQEYSRTAERPTKIEWPASTEVALMVAKHGWSATGRLLGVSDNAVRKRLRKVPPVVVDDLEQVV